MFIEDNLYGYIDSSRIGCERIYDGDAMWDRNAMK